MDAHAELFGKILFQPIVLEMLALFAFVIALRGTFRVGTSVSLIWIAAAAMVFGIDRAMHRFNPLLRDTLVVWAALLFIVFSVCAVVWIRERSEERKLSTAPSMFDGAGE
jgi:hypothetical protein